MSTAEDRSQMQAEYEQAAQDYLHSLPLEHFMESTDQATQRKITLESLDLVHARRPEVQTFNELLVQYPVPDRPRPRQVVPDNMVVRWEEPIEAAGSYDIPFQPVGPFWVLEYVSKSSERKDYEDSFKKYEEDLKVPYHLTFYPQVQDLTLYRHNGTKYVTVTPNAQGRYPIPELEVELGLQGGWIRFWYRGELLPLPAELEQSLAEANRRAAEEQRRREQAERAAKKEKRNRAAAEQRAQDAEGRAEELAHRAEEQSRRLEDERQARHALEQRLTELQAQLAQRPPEQNLNP